MDLSINGLALAGSSTGIANYTRRLIEGLVRHAPEVRLRVLLPGHYRQRISEELARVVELVPGKPPSPHPLLSEIWWHEKITRYAIRTAPDSVFLATGDMWATKRPRTNVQVMHDCLLERFPELAGRRWVRRFYRRACLRWARRASLVVTASRFAANDLVHLGKLSHTRIAVVPSWLDRRFDRRPSAAEVDRLRARLQLPERYWLYVGGYLKHKNVNALVEAYASARKDASLPPLVLAGSIRRKAESLGLLDPLSLGERLEVSDAIRAVGFLSDDDLPALYRGAALFVYPSLHEGFGYAPAEALAMGTACLVSNRASIPEVAPAPHCQFDPENVPALADALRSASVDSQRFTQPFNEAFREANGIRRFLAAVSGAVH